MTIPQPQRMTMDDMPGADLGARLANVEALLVAILNQLRNGVKTKESLANIDLVGIPALITVE